MEDLFKPSGEYIRHQTEIPKYLKKYGVNEFRNENNAIILITHYKRLLDYIEPDKVHVLSNGTIIQSGDKTLATTLEKTGYKPK
mgnify:CR=1 FL=1